MDNTAKLWNKTTGNVIFTLTHSIDVLTASFSPDGNLIATGIYDSSNNLRIWNTSTGI